jgi:hypothetical protein
MCDYVLSYDGLFPTLLHLIKTEKDVSLLRNAAWILLNLCRYTKPALERVEELLPAITTLLQHKDVSILHDTVWALYNLTRNYLIPCGS